MINQEDSAQKKYPGINWHRLEHYRQTAGAYSLQIAVNPFWKCSVCGCEFPCVPYIIVDGNSVPICFECAEIAKVPLLPIIKYYKEAHEEFKGFVNCGEDGDGYIWYATLKKGLKPNFHTQALLTTIAERAAAHNVRQLFYCSIESSEPFLRADLQQAYPAEEVYERLEEELYTLIDNAQDSNNHIEYCIFKKAYYEDSGFTQFNTGTRFLDMLDRNENDNAASPL